MHINNQNMNKSHNHNTEQTTTFKSPIVFQQLKNNEQHTIITQTPTQPQTTLWASSEYRFASGSTFKLCILNYVHPQAWVHQLSVLRVASEFSL